MVAEMFASRFLFTFFSLSICLAPFLPHAQWETNKSRYLLFCLILCARVCVCVFSSYVTYISLWCLPFIGFTYVIFLDRFTCFFFFCRVRDDLSRLFNFIILRLICGPSNNILLISNWCFEWCVAEQTACTDREAEHYHHIHGFLIVLQ